MNNFNIWDRLFVPIVFCLFLVYLCYVGGQTYRDKEIEKLNCDVCKKIKD